jgi:hypothetical protein
MAGWWWVDGEELVRAGAAVLHTVLHTQSLWWALCVDEPVWGRGGGVSYHTSALGDVRC